MKLTYLQSRCIVLITAIDLGYECSFNRQILEDIATEIKKISYCDVTTLEKEAITLTSQIIADGLQEKANKMGEILSDKLIPH